MRRHRLVLIPLCLLIVLGCTLTTRSSSPVPSRVTATLAEPLPTLSVTLAVQSTASPETTLAPPPSATPLPTAAPTDTPAATATATLASPPTQTPLPSAIPPTRTLPGPTAAPPLDDGSGGVVPGTGGAAAAISPVAGVDQLPDTLYYLSDSGALAQVWRLRVGLNHPDQLTFSPTGVAAFDVAPDGTIAYHTPDGQMIIGGFAFLPPLDSGGTLPRVTALAWSPGGEWLAYTLFTPGASGAMGGPHPIDGVWIRDRQGTTIQIAPTVYATGDAWQVYGPPLSWRPDGREILAATEGAGERHVTRFDITTSRSQAILAGSELATDPLFSAQWSAAGDVIIASGAGQIVRVDPDTLATQTLLGPEAGFAPRLARQLASGSVSFLSADADGARLVLLPADQSAPQAVTAASGENVVDYLWDAAGRQALIVVSAPGNPTLGTASWRDSGGTLHDLTPLTGSVAAPQWGPLFQARDTARVHTTAGDTLNLRAVPDGQVVVQMVSGSLVMVVEGPRDEGGYRWWRVQTPNGVSGWAVESVIDERGLPLRTLLPTD